MTEENICRSCEFLKTEKWQNDRTAFICTCRMFDGNERTLEVVKRQFQDGVVLVKPIWCKK